MKRRFFIGILAGAMATLLIVAAVYFASSRGRAGSFSAKGEQEEALYYTCGMHPSVHVTPEEYKKGRTQCPICSMDLIPVLKEKAAPQAVPASSGKKGKILYYRNPMDPSVTSAVPAKDSMGMDYIPVYAEETPSSQAQAGTPQALYYGCGQDTFGHCPHCDLGQADAACICGQHAFVVSQEEGITKCPICGKELKPLAPEEADRLKGVVSRLTIKSEQLELAGVATEALEVRALYKEIRTVGRVAFDPDLAVAEQEYVSALESSDKAGQGTFEDIRERAADLVDASRKKLLLMGLSAEQIEELARTRQVQDSLVLPQQEMWIYGDAYEYESDWVRSGAKVIVTTQAMPGVVFEGTIASVNPVIDPKTRTFRFRAQVENPGLALKPEMYVDILVQSAFRAPDGSSEVLALPKDALLDTGVRRIVWVDMGGGHFEGREVTVGPLASANAGGSSRDFYPVLRGLADGERVVTKANFLIDSQSQISGAASAAYGGALGEKKAEETASMPGMQM
ncbi:MAG: efflux RND transporter periplasmic adaptor subunit [Deltaproteobacteria bacterium]